ncbi:hypothetical protein BIW11_09643, partial [Tropilaelaps mercedesae]
YFVGVGARCHHYDGPKQLSSKTEQLGNLARQLERRKTPNKREDETGGRLTRTVTAKRLTDLNERVCESKNYPGSQASGKTPKSARAKEGIVENKCGERQKTQVGKMQQSTSELAKECAVSMRPAHDALLELSSVLEESPIQVSAVAATKIERKVWMKPAEAGQPWTDQMDQAILTGNILRLLPETMLIFDPDAFLQLFPYCRAILEGCKFKVRTVSESLVPSDSPKQRMTSALQEMDDEELFKASKSVGIYVPAIVIDDLRRRATGTHCQRTAVEAIKMLSRELLKGNQYLEIQGCITGVSADRSSLRQSNEVLHERAIFLSMRGKYVFAVTDDTPTQTKLLSSMIKWLNVMDFLSRFDWLTQRVTVQIDTTLYLIGQEAIFRQVCGSMLKTYLFAELISMSVIWKAIVALLAPMAMPSRLALFPFKPLKGVLEDILYHQKPLQTIYLHNMALDFSLVEKLIASFEDFLLSPVGMKRAINFASVLDDLIELCHPIAKLFTSMRTRVDLLAAVRVTLDRFVLLVPPESPGHPEAFDVFTEQISLTSTPRRGRRERPAQDVAGGHPPVQSD